jgi:hypothetical protein
VLTYQENAPVLDAVFCRLGARVSQYPRHLREQGEAFLAWAGPGYFSQADAAPLMHLPLWMPQTLPADVMADLLDATALAYAYVRIQDNVIDEPTGRGNPPMLLLGNAFLWDALALWRRHTDATFEAHARRAWLEFSDLSEAERRQLLHTDGYPHAEFARHAGKCAMAEVPLYAVMSAAADWRGAEAVPTLVHGLARSYGCVNDVLGWERDLQSGANTYLLARARALAGPGASPEAIRRALLVSPLLEELLTEAQATLSACRGPAEALGLRRFEAFMGERTTRLGELHTRVTLVRLSTLLAA